ncbi:unnamed protein product [Mytilus edulis]|uniref:Uncharacterized protein n=1 Tax=Mytilus edulis TaxID=6550 RepID=A0A8S3Q4X4_MYTED|nr:unnamed protein product [Mytilus edulis]
MNFLSYLPLLLPAFVGSQNVWNMMPQGGGEAQQFYGQMPPQYAHFDGAAGSMWGNMQGNPQGMPSEMMGPTPAPDPFGSTTNKPTRREYMLKQATKRKVDGPKIPAHKRNYLDFGSMRPIPTNKDELELFVESLEKMATGFHRLEFRLTKAFKMVDKYITTL